MLNTADLHGSLEDPALTWMNLPRSRRAIRRRCRSRRGRHTEQFFDVGSLHPADFVARVRGARERDLRPRGCYVTPDFANPSGAMSN